MMSDEIAPQRNDPLSPRRRGGQPGNTNRLKHGLYSNLISSEDEAELESMELDRNHSELKLARARLKACFEKQQTADPKDWLSYERAIAFYLRIIAMLTHRNATQRAEDKTAFMTVLEMIRQVNEEQGVK